MRPWPHDAHFSPEHIQELRKFIDTEFSQPCPRRINSIVTAHGLTSLLAMCRVHRPVLENPERPFLQACPELHVKNGAGRLQFLNEPDQKRREWEYQDQDNKADHNVHRPFQKPVDWIFQRFIAKSDKL